ncbi:acyl carrier protein [Streptomyces sp. NPDC005925]|uniref:acyl carrier protein n=1 Tax=Streptomyces sp. NPDC005925 TaxID=3157172 RepID=UPI0033F87D08
MSGPALAPGREDVIALLAEQGECAPEAVGERIDSLQLAWLVHAVEERYGVRLDLDDDELEAMDTVEGAVAVLGTAMTGAAPDRGAT